MTQLVFLEDAKATTIKGVTSAIKEFRETQPAPIADLMVVTDPPMRDPGNINLGIRTDVVDDGVSPALAITYDVATDTPEALLGCFARARRENRQAQRNRRQYSFGIGQYGCAGGGQ